MDHFFLKLKALLLLLKPWFHGVTTWLDNSFFFLPMEKVVSRALICMWKVQHDSYDKYMVAFACWTNLSYC